MTQPTEWQRRLAQLQDHHIAEQKQLLTQEQEVLASLQSQQQHQQGISEGAINARPAHHQTITLLIQRGGAVQSLRDRYGLLHLAMRLRHQQEEQALRAQLG